jgi:Na+-driven multidrug efflux pump
MILFPKIIISLFSNQPMLVKTSVWAMRIYMSTAFVMGAQLACQQTFIIQGQLKSSLFETKKASNPCPSRV